MRTLPVTFTWDGDAMVPLPRFRSVCNRQYVVHEEYVLGVDEQRSGATHNHFFASLEEGWRNLPEEIAENFPSREHLRKRALIATGFADERTYSCDSEFEAHRIAAFTRPLDDYAVIIVSGTVVRVYTAQSQSRKEMGKERFQKSKQAVLDYVASLVGVTVDSLAENAMRIA